MARPRTEPTPARRSRIREATKKLLIQKGYEGIRLDEVARKAGIAKGTIYLYYKDKESLLTAVMEDLLGTLNSKLTTIPPQDCGRKALLRLAEEHLDFVDKHKDFLIQLAKECPDVCAVKSPASFQAIFDRFLTDLARRIQACIHGGLLRAHDPKLGAFLFMSLVRIFLIRKIIHGAKKPLKTQAADVLNLFLNGLGAGTRKK